MTDTATSIYARADTMLGVCHGLGEELGIHANWFRVAALLGLFWNPTAVFVTYAVLGVLLGLFRWAFPLRHRTGAVTAEAAMAPRRGDNDDAAPVFSEAA